MVLDYKYYQFQVQELTLDMMMLMMVTKMYQINLKTQYNKFLVMVFVLKHKYVLIYTNLYDHSYPLAWCIQLKMVDCYH